MWFISSPYYDITSRYIKITLERSLQHAISHVAKNVCPRTAAEERSLAEMEIPWPRRRES
jgi:hypothetical protein